MSETGFFHLLLTGWFITAGAIFVTLQFVPAPYGRHWRSTWGPSIGNRTGWLFMEAPAVIIFAICFAFGEHLSPTALAFFVMWQAHYVHRAFVYPFSLKNSRRQMPLVIVAAGFLFNTVNAYLNGRWLFTLSGGYDSEWLLDPRFLSGLTLFITGYVINRQADSALHLLRQSNNNGYQIPNGGLYRWISCPNYLGEIIIWTGWAVATWSLVGTSFAAWTIANLAPRARWHHRWYQQKFAEYPKERKALIPKLW